MPVIPATQKAEAGGSQFQTSVGKVSKILSEKQNTRWGTVVQACNPSYLGGGDPRVHPKQKCSQHPISTVAGCSGLGLSSQLHRGSTNRSITVQASSVIK
jgi:hypothetical protein